LQDRKIGDLKVKGVNYKSAVYWQDLYCSCKAKIGLIKKEVN